MKSIFNIKKLFALLFTITLLISLYACGQKGDSLPASTIPTAGDLLPDDQPVVYPSLDEQLTVGGDGTSEIIGKSKEEDGDVKIPAETGMADDPPYLPEPLDASLLCFMYVEPVFSEILS